MESKNMSPEIKRRINKIDFELKQFFENVYIQDKYYKTGFFEIIANKVTYLKESRDYKRLEAKVIINQPDLLQDSVKWSYSTNPLNENALWIDRYSDLNSLSQDIIQLVEQVRFDESYILSLEPIVDVINENVVEDEVVKEYDFQEILSKILEKYNIEISIKQSEIHSVHESFINKASDRILRFYHNSDIKISDKFKIESEMLALENVNWCVFKEEYIELNYTPIL